MKEQALTYKLHMNDLPADVDFGDSVAIDTEAMGLNPLRDRLCMVQLSAGDGIAHLVQMTPDTDYKAPRLKALLENPKVLKIFHYARFDVAILKQYLNVETAPFYCTKIASKLSRTYTDRHSLKTLCHSLLNVNLEKEAQASNWGAADPTEAQCRYAANDVLYLHDLKKVLDEMLVQTNRTELADACFKAIPVITNLELEPFDPNYIFSH